jgi:hypothetical protein
LGYSLNIFRHASEISSVFGLVEKTAGKEQIEVSTFMNKAWAEFAKNPEGLSKLNLPVYSATGKCSVSGRVDHI